MKAASRQLARFIAVGTAAALVHLAVVAAIVRLADWPPLLANVAGWMVAFGVSFMGHYGWTFRGTALSRKASARRFVLLSFGGFVFNEAMYAVALRWSALRFDVALAGVLVITAVLTFLASRHWAFRGTPGP